MDAKQVQNTKLNKIDNTAHSPEYAPLKQPAQPHSLKLTVKFKHISTQSNDIYLFTCNTPPLLLPSVHSHIHVSSPPTSLIKLNSHIFLVIMSQKTLVN